MLATTIADAGRAARFVDGVGDAARGGRRACGRPAACRASRSSRPRRSRAASSSSRRDGARSIAATTRPDPTVGLVFYDLKHCLRSIEDERPRRPPVAQARAPRRRQTRCRRVGSCTGADAGRRIARRLGALSPPRGAAARARRSVRGGRLDGLDRRRLARRRAAAHARARADGARAVTVDGGARGRDPRGRAARGRLRPPLGQAQLLLPRQVPLRHAARTCCGRSARRSPLRSREHEPEAVRLAAPELGAVPLAAAASLELGLPFVIVRGRGEGVRDREPDRGRLRARRLRLPRRGRGHLRRRRDRGGRGAPRGRIACLQRGLRRRSRGRGRRRPRPRGRSPPLRSSGAPSCGWREAAARPHG